jgi:hypothetical protein
MSEASPYPPSWVDRFTAWVERLPAPAWIYYLALWLVLYIIQFATQWTNGAAGSPHPFHLLFAGAIPFYLALIHYLDRTADAALSRFRPVLDCSDIEHAELRYRLTTLPARPTLLVTLFGIVLGGISLLALPLDWRLSVWHFSDSTASIYFTSAILVLAWALVTLLAYHTLHQLNVVRQIYERASVNLFNLRPLYAFSDLSARTAIGMQLFVSGWYILAPELLSNNFAAVLGVLLTAVAMLTFVWPLLGTHRLLVDEKNRLLGEQSELLEAAIKEVNRRISSKEVQEMEDWHKALESLEIEHTALSRISTWPWRPETLQSFVATLVLPVVIWLIQWFLQRFLSS